MDIDAEWRISSLPWNLVPAREGDLAPRELDPAFLAALEKIAAEYTGPSAPASRAQGRALSKTAQGAAVAWLYAYMTAAGARSEA